MERIFRTDAEVQEWLEANGGHFVVVYQKRDLGWFGGVCHAAMDPDADLCWVGERRETPTEALNDGRGHYLEVGLYGLEPLIHHCVFEGYEDRPIPMGW